MSANDELLFGNDPTPRREEGRDSDGDGVSDVQEGLDGTDANDALSNIRHDAPVMRPDDHDPRDHIGRASLEREVSIDVAATNPTDISLDQSLPTGLHGESLTAVRHYGNAEADQMMGTHVDQNSPLNMQRSPLGSGSSSTVPAPGSGGERTIPPGTELGSRAPNLNLVGADLPEYEEPPDSGGGVIEWVKDLFTPEPKWGPGPLKEFVPPAEPAPPHVPLPPQRGPKMAPVGTVDPDAGGGGVGVGDGDVERAILLAGADTDFVQGAGAPKIGLDSVPPPARDLVTDRNPDGDGTEIDISTAVAPPPGGGFTDGVNPDSGFFTPPVSSPAPQPGSGGNTGDQQARQGQSYSATADDSSEEQPHGISSEAGISLVGTTASGGGINSVSDITGLASSGPAIESTDGDGGREVVAAPADVELATGIIIPDVGRPLPAMEALEPLDPVAAAMVPSAELTAEVPSESFDGLAIDDSMAIPDGVDLDDGF